MIPIHLNWPVPADGAELSQDADGAKILQAASARTKATDYEVVNLEDPLSIRFVNAKSETELIAFVSRFGFLQIFASTPNSQHFNYLESVRDEIEELLAMSSHEAKLWVRHANKLLQNTALHPTFEFSADEGRQRIIFRPSTLEDLMFMECAVALEVGAVLARCEHCGKAFLTGPLTGRRSHAKFCSDRCRVAAMRARKAAKEAWQEDF